MKLFAVLSALLFLGLPVNVVSQNRFISEADCIEWGARCTREPCVKDMVFHGMCKPDVSCCKRDPVPYCQARGGTCIEGECGRDDSFLMRCSRKRVCCRPPKTNNVRY